MRVCPRSSSACQGMRLSLLAAALESPVESPVSPVELLVCLSDPYLSFTPQCTPSTAMAAYFYCYIDCRNSAG